MKNLSLKLIIAGTMILLAFQFGFAQQPSEKTAALRIASGAYLSMVAGGGLDASGKEIGKQQIFTIVDANGGELEDGDKVKIVYETSLWREDKENNKIHRVAIKGSKDAETVFKVKRKDKMLMLQTPSGKYLAIDGAAIVTTDKQDKAALLELVASVPPAQSQGYPTAFRLASGKYLGMVAGGGLDAGATQISPKQIFTLVDLDGGSLNNGDSVKIMFEASLWREDKENGKIHRVPIKGAKDDECTFKIKVQGKSVLLQTPSGKFVSASPDGKAVLTTDKRDETSLLEAIPQSPPNQPQK